MKIVKMSGGSQNHTIDAASPLYVHPSDGPRTVELEPKLQGSGNYRAWRRDMEISLSAKRKLGFITGGVKRDENDATKKEAWDTCNNLVISWLVHSVSESIKQSIMFMGSAQQIWKNLEARFSVTNGVRKYSLSRQIYETTQHGRSISEFYTDMRVIWEELETLFVMPPLSENDNPEVAAYLKAVETQKNEQKLFQFLSGIDDTYNQQRSHILHMTPLPSVEEACNLLQQEENQRAVFSHTKDGGAMAMAMNTRKGDLTCSNCGKAGHTKDHCWACKFCGKRGHQVDQCWHIKGFPPGVDKGKKKEGTSKEKSGLPKEDRFKGEQRGNKGGGKKFASNVKAGGEEASGSGNSSTVITAQQLEKLIKMLPTLTKTDENEGEEEMDFNLYSGMVACNLVKTAENEWIIDSGATHHMSGNQDMFCKILKVKQQHSISLPNGGTADVQGVGAVDLGNNLKLSNVLYLPSFKHNLVSVKKLSDEASCKVVFLANYCLIQDEKTGEVKAVGKEKQGLYYLQQEPVYVVAKRIMREAEQKLKQRSRKRSAAHAMTVGSELKIPDRVEGVKRLKKSTIWHLRLGHIPEERMRMIEELKDVKMEPNEICITCPQAKQTKLPFPHSQSRALKPFELIHLDIWGPYRVAARGGYKYFMTIVDDHSRMTWVNLLKHKDEAFEVIKKFIHLAETHYEGKVKHIRSDNALEFDDDQCKFLYEKHGILHQTSCINTPQQNGRVERKHRNILEMARGLRFQANLPVSFWGDCVMGAVHITNKLPTHVLQKKSPYEVLFKTKPSYDNLKVFGCLALAYNPEKHHDKFKARGVPCVFLGYPQNQKGYKLYNLITQNVFVTRHVKFYEHVFPYKLFEDSNQSQKSVVVSVSPIYDEEFTENENHPTENPETKENIDQEAVVSDQAQNEHEQIVETEQVTGPRRTSRPHFQPKWQSDYIMNMAAS